MKRILLLFVIILTPFFFLACGDDSEDENVNMLRVNGQIGTVITNKSVVSNSTEIKKVLVYRDFGDADISDVDDNGNFSVSVERKPCGLIFLDEMNLVVGYLSLASGIEAIPLTMVEDSVGEINLQNIDFVAGVGTPGHNPIDPGGEMEMSATELAVYKLQSSLFSAIIRNLDMNRDNIVDVLSERPYWLRFGADFNGGTPGTSDPGVSGSLPSLNVFHFNFSDYHDGVDAPTATLTAPDATVFNCHQVDNRMLPVQQYHWVLQNGWSSFVSGQYTVTYDTDGKEVTFDITSPLKSDNYIVAAYLWYEMDGSTMYKAHWKWKMLNGSDIDATKLLQKNVILQFQFNDNTQKNFHVTPADTECVVNIDEASMLKLSQILVSCTDLFGNWQPTFYNMVNP